MEVVKKSGRTTHTHTHIHYTHPYSKLNRKERKVNKKALFQLDRKKMRKVISV